MKATTERAFEDLIEEHLVEHGGYVSRPPDAYDAYLALLPDDLLADVAHGGDGWGHTNTLRPRGGHREPR